MSVFVKGKVIHTKRLVMRKPNIEDVDQLYNILKKEAVGQWLAKSRGMSIDETKDYMSQLILHWEQYDFGVWLLFKNETGETEIMYLLDSEYWRNGYASEAAEASIQYATETMNLKRIIARVKVANENSKKLLRKLGFTYTQDVDHSGRLLSYFELNTSSDGL
ncbi:GNAT family N-acetyltransferase [Bacillus thuringiensis]|uniref:GNAT family N-acetyltransferase n=1 Tax=Bacillus thuringiensis TaxID=1428 RepID=UPI0022245786|nr:GNAT family N-acetyltransferase [Bacillus thuringiensis]UYX55123.1 GNAT family N-acetyltransferase [Bacillus thuringiensis]